MSLKINSETPNFTAEVSDAVPIVCTFVLSR